MKTNSTIRGIAHGHMTKDNLTGFASMMTSDARTLSLARIAHESASLSGYGRGAV